jgi:hypothetical protein
MYLDHGSFCLIGLQRAASQLPELMELETRLTERIQNNKDELKALTKKLDKVLALLSNNNSSNPAPESLPPQPKPRGVRAAAYDRTPSDSEAE